MDRSKWEYKKLGEVCDLYQPKTISSDMLVPDGKYLVYGANGVIGKYNKYNHEKSEVLMTCRGATCGTINVSAPYSWINGNAMVVHPRTIDLNAQYLVYQLKAADKTSVITGAAQPQITRQMLQTLPFVVAPITDQQRIVAELDCLNEMIALKQEQLKEFDKLTQSIFYDMFRESYNTKFLGEFCEVGTGATPDRKKEAIYYGGNTNWVKTTEVQNSDIYETEESITEIALEQTNCKVYPSGTILMAMYGQGKTRGQVARLMIKAATNQACAAIIPDTKVCDKDYLYVYLLLSYEKIRNMARGGNQANLNLGLVKKISVPLPPLALQQQFAEKIQAIEAQKELVKKSIAETQQLLDSRMDYYFD